MHFENGRITQLLRRREDGDLTAESELIELLYAELRRIALYHVRNERPNHTLRPTELINEAYLRMLKDPAQTWKDRVHFLAVAAAVMRRILVDHARRRGSLKRGQGQGHLDIEDAIVYCEENSEVVIAVDRALERLEELDTRQCKVVELRFFGGLTEEEIAAELGVSVRTVKRDWAIAKAWLYAELA